MASSKLVRLLCRLFCCWRRCCWSRWRSMARCSSVFWPSRFLPLPTHRGGAGHRSEDLTGSYRCGHTEEEEFIGLDLTGSYRCGHTEEERVIGHRSEDLTGSYRCGHT